MTVADFQQASTPKSSSPSGVAVALPALLGKSAEDHCTEEKCSEQQSTACPASELPLPPPCDSATDCELGASTKDVELEGRVQPLTRCEKKLVLGLVGLASLDLLMSPFLAIFAFTYAFRCGGVSLYCMALQAISHFSSSIVLVFRFMPALLTPRGDDGAVTDDVVLQHHRAEDLRHERIFALSMGVGMLLSCVVLLFKALQKMRLWSTWYLDHSEYDAEVALISDIIAWWGFGGYLFHATIRGVCACRVRVSVAWNGFCVSTVSLIFFLVLGLAVTYQREWSWKAEPIAAIVLVAVMLCEGIRMILTNLGSLERRLARNVRF